MAFLHKKNRRVVSEDKVQATRENKKGKTKEVLAAEKERGWAFSNFLSGEIK